MNYRFLRHPFLYRSNIPQNFPPGPSAESMPANQVRGVLALHASDICRGPHREVQTHAESLLPVSVRTRGNAYHMDPPHCTRRSYTYSGMSGYCSIMPSTQSAEAHAAEKTHTSGTQGNVDFLVRTQAHMPILNHSLNRGHDIRTSLAADLKFSFVSLLPRALTIGHILFISIPSSPSISVRVVQTV